MTFKKSILLALTLLAVLPVASGCGVKPGNVKPPEGAADVYPSVYPKESAE